MISIRNIDIPQNVFDSLSIGDTVEIPTWESGVLSGVIHYKDTANGVIAGVINSDASSNFELTYQNGQYQGKFIDSNTDYGYRIATDTNVELILAYDINHLLCVDCNEPHINIENLESAPDSPSNQYYQSLSRTTEVPALSSRPGAQRVLYLDFDGEYVVHPSWNGGLPIDAQPADYIFDGEPSSFSEEEIDRIKNVWEGVAEDFVVFDVNVTTDRSKFDAAQAEHRQQIIITSTTWYPGSAAGIAGVAYVDVFAEPTDTPAWSFYFFNSIFSASVISHELGHTLGLFHDGLDTQTYHPGSGYWGPIMGSPGGDAASADALTTWSNGDYAGATNTFQDDVALMGLKLGFFPDQYQESAGSALAAKSIQSGIIGADDDVDSFYIDLRAGQTLSLSLDTYAYPYPNLDSQVKLKNASGITLVSSNPVPLIDGEAPVLNSNIDFSISETGRYYIEVNGVGYSDSIYGYSSYGSLGSYTLEITRPNLPNNVDLTVILYLLLF